MDVLFLDRLKKIRQDFFASITVALVAIPLCLGVAMASGVPLFAGILTGAIGGIVVGLLSESRVSVSGPAAGMIAIVICVVNTLGSYPLFLLALCIAGLIQMLIGFVRGGVIANYVPTNVIQGLLAAIGLLIIFKQIPIAIGYAQDSDVLAHTLEQTEEAFSVPYLWHALDYVHVSALLVTIVSLIILLLWEKKFTKIAKIVPASVVVVVFSVLLNKIISIVFPPFALEGLHLVRIPVIHSLAGFLQQLKFPDASGFTNIKVYTYAAMIAAVASLETLLNIEGIEKIDKKHRYVSRNRELVAQGVGNMCSGFLGGIPVTSVIVRSSVNIYAGANSKLSTVLHGLILIASMTLISACLNYIPLSALAAILIHVGYKLASVALFKKAYKEGIRYFLPFLVTTVAIIFTNLLTGVLIGLSVSILFILYHNTRNGLTVVNEDHTYGKIMRFILPQQITFLNKAFMINMLNTIPENGKVVIDANSTDYIDNDVLGVIKDFKDEQAPEKNILLNLIGFKDRYNIPDGFNFITATTRDTQQKLTHQDVLKILIEGNKRFVSGTSIHKDFKHQIQITSQSQHPIGVVLSCIDSRVPVEIVFDLTVGDLFVTRIAGNVGNLDIVGSIEFACHVAQAKLVVVLGHRECGAIKAACNHFEFGHITQLLHKIEPAIQLEEAVDGDHPDKTEWIDRVTLRNVKLTRDYLIAQSDVLRKMQESNQINIVSAIYDVHTGVIAFE